METTWGRARPPCSQSSLVVHGSPGVALLVSRCVLPPGTSLGKPVRGTTAHALPSDRLWPEADRVRYRFSLPGYTVDEPLHDRIESLLIECVSTVDAERGDEIAGDPGHDLIGIPRILVPGTRHDQCRPGSDG